MLKWIASMAAMLLYGCVLTVPPAPTAETGLKPPTPAFEDTENRYYYYLEAQIQQSRGNVPDSLQYLEKTLHLDPKSSYLRRELARLYLHLKKSPQAVQILEQLIANDPDDVEARILFARIKQEQKHYPEAIQAYERVIELDPGLQDIYQVLGNLYLQVFDWDNATRVFQQLTTHFPADYIGHFFLGRCYFQQRDYAAAEKAFNTTLELQAELEEPLYELARLYSHWGRPSDAVAIYTEMIAKDPDNVRGALELGVLQHSQGQIAEAERIFYALGVRSQQESGIIRNVIEYYLDSKQFESALVILENMLPGAPQSSDLHYLIGIAYDGTGAYDHAISNLSQVGPGSEFFQNAVLHAAYLLGENQQIDAARTILTAGLAQRPNNTEFMLQLGFFHGEAGDYEQAQHILEQAIALDSQNPRLYFRLGVVYDQWGRQAECIANMQAVLRLDPQHVNAMNYLGYTYAVLGRNLDEAERLIRRALGFNPDDGYITDSLGWVYYQKGLYPQALIYLEKAIRLVPDDPIILEHLGDVHHKLNHRAKALDYYRQSLLKRQKDREPLEEKIRQFTTN